MGNWLQYQWGAAVMVVGWGKTLFVFMRFFLKFVFSSSFVGCVIDIVQAGWTVCKSATKLQLFFVTVSCCRFFIQTELSTYIPYWLGTFVVASARRCFSSKLVGNGIFFHHRCRERVWVRICGLIELSSSTLAQLHRRHCRFCYDSMWVLNLVNG